MCARVLVYTLFTCELDYSIRWTVVIVCILLISLITRVYFSLDMSIFDQSQFAYIARIYKLVYDVSHFYDIMKIFLLLAFSKKLLLY